MSYQGHSRSLSEESSKDFNASIPPATRKDTIHLTPYSRPPLYNPADHHDSRRQYQTWSGEDPRSSSTQSLLPEHLPGDGRRTLLLVYIHGFMGDDTSFQKFPAHVHNLLTITLIETHVIHTKIYPRYKSRGAIAQAADDFSHWLSPHESPDTDIILLGHSLGGILAAEVALLRSHAPGSRETQSHRILGTLSFDTPFLGLHPSVVKTGIGSLFRSKQKTENTPQDISESLASTTLNDSAASPFTLPTSDPNYDPAFSNDIRLTQRSQLDGAIHFITKYSDRLAQATRQYITSHVEFGSCLADYPSLKRRYKAIRELEDIDDFSQARGPDRRFLRRVRFANYYTASTGRSKPAPPNSDPKGTRNISEGEISQSAAYDRTSRTKSAAESAQLAVDEYGKDTSEGELITTSSQASKSRNETMTPDVAVHGPLDVPGYGLDGSSSHSLGNYPPIPPLPDAIPEFDPSLYTTEVEQKEAFKEHSKSVKSYEKAIKERDKAVRNRDKIIDKAEKAAAKEQQQHARKNNINTSSEHLTLGEAGHHICSDSFCGQASGPHTHPTPPKKDRKFCALPPKDADGFRDPLWIRVHMKGMDEVVAHQSLFFPSEAYERLVGDVSAQIEQWVNDDATSRMIMTEMGNTNA